MQWVQQVRDSVPHADVCCHWSIKQHYKRGADETHPQLQQHLAALQESAASSSMSPSVFLCNGSGPKRPYNTVTALEMLSADQSKGHTVPVHVAFNPYLPEVRAACLYICASCVPLARCMLELADVLASTQPPGTRFFSFGAIWIARKPGNSLPAYFTCVTLVPQVACGPVLQRLCYTLLESGVTMCRRVIWRRRSRGCATSWPAALCAVSGCKWALT